MVGQTARLVWPVISHLVSTNCEYHAISPFLPLRLIAVTQPPLRFSILLCLLTSHPRDLCVTAHHVISAILSCPVPLLLFIPHPFCVCTSPGSSRSLTSSTSAARSAGQRSYWPRYWQGQPDRAERRRERVQRRGSRAPQRHAATLPTLLLRHRMARQGLSTQ